jgi:hypothetical protein
MFKKKPDGQSPKDPSLPKRDEHAYEDAWYRALKAQAERRAMEASDESEEPEAPEV